MLTLVNSIGLTSVHPLPQHEIGSKVPLDTRTPDSLQRDNAAEHAGNVCPVGWLSGDVCLRHDGEAARGWQWSMNGVQERRCGPRRRPRSTGSRRRISLPSSRWCWARDVDVQRRNRRCVSAVPDLIDEAIDFVAPTVSSVM